MKPVEQERTLISSGVEEQASFGISIADQAHIMRILRDQLYSDRVLAVLREYSTNAWDANRMAGRGDRPIEIDLPTSLQHYLCIRDCGPGLSRDDVFKVYSQYGASTKRDTDVAVGMLGIGSKSAFSYTSSFTVTSWHGGTKSIYNATLDERDVGVIQLLHEEPCGPETGVEIKVPIKTGDIPEFKKKSASLFQYFRPLPKFNIDVEFRDPPKLSYVNGFICDIDESSGNDDGQIAILGCIPYRISHSEINKALYDIPLLRGCSRLGIFFEIGEADFSANREELKYTDRTRSAIVKRARLLAEEIKKDIDGVWSRTDMTQWQKRLRIEEFAAATNIHAYDIFKSLGLERKPQVKFETFEQKFTHITPDPQLCFVIRDDYRTIEGFEFPSGMMSTKRNNRTNLLVPLKTKGDPNATPPVAPKNFGPKDVENEILQVLKDNKCEGLPVRFLSSFPWKRPQRVGAAPVLNSKHAQSAFVYNGSSITSTASENWSFESFIPADDDVFVILDRFIPIGLPDYLDCFKLDMQLAKLANRQFPKVRGYKTTGKKPILVETCKGIHYPVWRKKFHEECISDPKVRRMLEDREWSSHFYSYAAMSSLRETLKSLKSFGVNDQNIINTFFKRAIEALERSRVDKQYDELLLKLRPSDFSSEVDQLCASVTALYPLVGKTWIMHPKDLKDIEHWVEYIKLKDMQRSSVAKSPKGVVPLDRVG